MKLTYKFVTGETNETAAVLVILQENLGCGHAMD
jgi:hypothetical protein